MKFVGLDGLKHFWAKAKSWIAEQITTEVTAKIAEIVANAPEDLDTLKEIADWISSHANDAATMNTAISTNASDIATLKTTVAGKSDTGHTHTKSQITDFAHTHDDRYFTETEVTNKLAGKSDTGHTHTKAQITDFPSSLKNPNTLTINGKTYDGSSAVNVGVQTVANGGTGQTTANDAANSFINSLTVGTAVPVDDDYYVCQFANGRTNTTTYHRRPVSKLWEYIKGKISSVLGLTATAYGGKANTAGTADNAKGLKTFASWANPYLYDATNGVRYFVFKITMPSYFNSILIQVDSDVNYAQSRKYILGLWHDNASGFGYNVSVTDLGGTYNNFLRVWLGNDGNVYLQTAAVWASRILFSNLDEVAANITVEKIGASRLGSNTDLDGNVLFTPLADPIIDCGVIRSTDLSTASKHKHYLKSDEFIGTATNATNDGNGKNIANTYMPKSGGMFSGDVTLFSKLQGIDPESNISFTPGDVKINAVNDILLYTPNGNVCIYNGLIIDTDEIYIQSKYGYKRLDSYIKNVVTDSSVPK